MNASLLIAILLMLPFVLGGIGLAMALIYAMRRFGP